MIEALGQSPISTVATVGSQEFMSIFRKKTSAAFGNDKYASRYSRAYTSTRGILINREYVLHTNSPDLLKGYQFQFNPQTVSDVKNTLYETRQYAGMHYLDYIWGGGGERTISFQLFLDNTPQSKQRHFRPTEYGSKLAKEFKTEGLGYAQNENLGQRIANEVKGQINTFKEVFKPSKGPDFFEYIENDAYSISRVDERGILPEVELIQSFLYPAPIGDEETPKFAENGVINTEQFRPPAIVVLVLGPLYLEGIIKSAPVNYTLFDEDLTPIRGTIDIEFAVFEYLSTERKIKR